MVNDPAPELTRGEWHAVAIALSDAAHAACTPGGRGLFTKLYVALTGNQPAPPLADARLEAVRKFVAESRRTHRPAERHVPALVEQGFNCRQIKALALLSA